MNRPIKLLRLPDLRRRGITYSRQHIDRLVKKKRFPKPVKPGGPGGNASAWIDYEIDDHLAMLVAERDQEGVDSE